VLQAEVFLVDVSALREPFFEVAGGFDYVHAGNDSYGMRAKSNGQQLPRRHGDTEKIFHLPVTLW